MIFTCNLKRAQPYELFIVYLSNHMAICHVPKVVFPCASSLYFSSRPKHNILWSFLYKFLPPPPSTPLIVFSFLFYFTGHRTCKTFIKCHFVLFLISKDRIIRSTQRQFLKNICSEDDLRSRIFGTFVVKFLACLPLLGFRTSKKLYNYPSSTDFYSKKDT